jgi:MFS family permease
MEKEKLESSVSAIHTGSFGLGAILGPILGSLLTYFTNFEYAFLIMAFLVLILSFLQLVSQYIWTPDLKYFMEDDNEMVITDF